MAWYVNELSLCGQYQIPDDFLNDLSELMRLRRQTPMLAENLYCLKALALQNVTYNQNFREVVQRDKTLLQPVLAWLTKYGPFWDADRQQNQDDYFEYLGQDVTNQSLAEIARRKLAGQESVSVSFANGGFDHAPLTIEQGLAEERLAIVDIDNIWNFSKLSNDVLSKTPRPVNWEQMLNQAIARFNKLSFSPNCISALLMEPYCSYVTERVSELLHVLNEFMNCRCEDGTYSDRNNELIRQYFAGGKALFTDESESNKHDFKKEMTFPDFDRSTAEVFCSWHGKIKSPQYRIHFEWPSKTHQTLRVFYIGPKLTKR